MKRPRPPVDYEEMQLASVVSSGPRGAGRQTAAVLVLVCQLCGGLVATGRAELHTGKCKGKL